MTFVSQKSVDKNLKIQLETFLSKRLLETLILEQTLFLKKVFNKVSSWLRPCRYTSKKLQQLISGRKKKPKLLEDFFGKEAVGDVNPRTDFVYI